MEVTLVTSLRTMDSGRTGLFEKLAGFERLGGRLKAVSSNGFQFSTQLWRFLHAAVANNS